MEYIQRYNSHKQSGKGQRHFNIYTHLGRSLETKVSGGGDSRWKSQLRPASLHPAEGLGEGRVGEKGGEGKP